MYLPFVESSSSSGVNFLFGIVNALVFLVIVIVMTTLLVVLFKYKCYRVSPLATADRQVYALCVETRQVTALCIGDWMSG